MIHKTTKAIITIVILTTIASCNQRSTLIEIRGAIALREFELVNDGECVAVDRDIKTNATIVIRGDRGDIIGSSFLEPGFFDWGAGNCVYRFSAMVPSERSYLFELPNGWSLKGSVVGVNRIGF